MPIEEWKKRLVLALDDAINHALDDTTQLAMSVECYNCALPRRHLKSRFTFFKYLRLRDEFHTDAFHLSVRSSQNDTYAQILTEKDTGH